MSGDSQTDYDLIGGAPAVTAVVDRFYELILADPKLTDFFVDVDLPRLKRHQVMLVSHVLGGPAQYEGRELGEAHAHLAITPEHFERVVGHLVTVLNDAAVPADIIERVGVALGGAESVIVSAEPA